MQKTRSLNLPRTNDGDIDFAELDTDTVRYEDVEEGDILVYPEYEYICLVIAEPVHQLIETPTRYKVPTIGLDGIESLTDNWRRGKQQESRLPEVIDVLMTHAAYEIGEPKEEVMVFNPTNSSE